MPRTALPEDVAAALKRIDACTRQQPGHFGLRHQEQAVAGKADHFRLGGALCVAGRQFDQAIAAHRQPQADGFQHQADRISASGGRKCVVIGTLRLRR